MWEYWWIGMDHVMSQDMAREHKEMPRQQSIGYIYWLYGYGKVKNIGGHKNSSRGWDRINTFISPLPLPN